MFTIKKAAFCFFTILLFGSLVSCDQVSGEMKMEKIISEYIQFQKDMGKIGGEECLKIIPDVFSADIVKITDGHKHATGHTGLEKHCMELRNLYSTWHVNVKSQVVSDDKKSATIIYEITTDKAGVFEVVAFLKFTEDRKIQEINESYYQLEINQQD